MPATKTVINIGHKCHKSYYVIYSQRFYSRVGADWYFTYIFCPSRAKQNGCHFANGIFKCIFLTDVDLHSCGSNRNRYLEKNIFIICSFLGAGVESRLIRDIGFGEINILCKLPTLYGNSIHFRLQKSCSWNNRNFLRWKINHLRLEMLALVCW